MQETFTTYRDKTLLGNKSAVVKGYASCKFLVALSCHVKV